MKSWPEADLATIMGRYICESQERNGTQFLGPRTDSLVSATFVLLSIPHYPLYSHCLMGEGILRVPAGLVAPVSMRKPIG